MQLFVTVAHGRPAPPRARPRGQPGLGRPPLPTPRRGPPRLAPAARAGASGGEGESEQEPPPRQQRQQQPAASSAEAAAVGELLVGAAAAAQAAHAGGGGDGAAGADAGAGDVAGGRRRAPGGEGRQQEEQQRAGAAGWPAPPPPPPPLSQQQQQLLLLLRGRLDDLDSKFRSLYGRLDALEGTLLTLLHNVKERASRPAASAAGGPAAGGAAADAGLSEAEPDDVPELELGSEGGEEEEGSGLFDLKKLETSLSENINRGYLESVKRLRDLILAYEWTLHGKEIAERRGVAQFEQKCADAELDVPYDAISKLYTDPSDLSVLASNRLKLMARSCIQQAVDERYCAIYLEATNTAKELAHTGLKDMIPDSAGKVGGVIKEFLPLPGFLKK